MILQTTMKTWLKGGLIGGGIGLIVFLFFFFTSCWGLFNCAAGACGNPMACFYRNLQFILYGFVLGIILGFVFRKRVK